MGLELVELMMAVEEEFNVTIDDEEAYEINTPGELLKSILTKQGSDDPYVKAERWDQLRWLIAEQLDVPLHEVTETAGFVRDLDAG